MEGGAPKGWSLRELFYRSHTRILRRDFSANYRLDAGEIDRYVAFLADRYEMKAGRSSFLSNYLGVVP